MECNAGAFNSVKSEAVMKTVMGSGAGKNKVTCKKTEKKTRGGAPQVYKSFFTGTTCSWASEAATCMAGPDSGYQRMCPCNKVVTQLHWRVGAKKESCDVTCTKASTPASP